MGYSIYVGKPHVINSRSEFANNSELIKILYSFEDEKVAVEIQKVKRGWNTLFLRKRRLFACSIAKNV